MAKKSMRNQTIPKNTRQTASNSVGKNKKAKELGVPIVDEETVMRWMENEDWNN